MLYHPLDAGISSGIVEVVPNAAIIEGSSHAKVTFYVSSTPAIKERVVFRLAVKLGSNCRVFTMIAVKKIQTVRIVKV